MRRHAHPALHPVPPGGGHRRLVGRPDLGRAARPHGDRDGWSPIEGPDPAEGHHADAQLRRRADAARPAVPGRRRRAHRPADRRQGDEPGDRRHHRAGRGAGGIVPRARHDAAGATPRRAAPHLAGAALLLVDDVHAAPLRRRRPLRAQGCSSPSCDYVCGSAAAVADAWPRTMSACPCRWDDRPALPAYPPAGRTHHEPSRHGRRRRAAGRKPRRRAHHRLRGHRAGELLGRPGFRRRSLSADQRHRPRRARPGRSAQRADRRSRPRPAQRPRPGGIRRPRWSSSAPPTRPGPMAGCSTT